MRVPDESVAPAHLNNRTCVAEVITEKPMTDVNGQTHMVSAVRQMKRPDGTTYDTVPVKITALLDGDNPQHADGTHEVQPEATSHRVHNGKGFDTSNWVYLPVDDVQQLLAAGAQSNNVYSRDTDKSKGVTTQVNIDFDVKEKTTKNGKTYNTIGLKRNANGAIAVRPTDRPFNPNWYEKNVEITRANREHNARVREQQKQAANQVQAAQPVGGQAQTTQPIVQGDLAQMLAAARPMPQPVQPAAVSVPVSAVDQYVSAPSQNGPQQHTQVETPAF